MFEYGGGISEGPAGQVGGTSGGSGRGGGDLDWGAQLIDRASDAVTAVAALPTEQLLLLIAVLLAGMWVLRRAL
jgi:hypothetical protein